ncbi:hypothetical protein [Bacillus thuringiensis]|uniref:hypothetical protein n=1 Tax=Bacillus thuringiensis TaxID=1428 RepID=UPI000BFDD684|nr:hypothetical protein [Bacillus thuringiensis]PGT90042.1 hypothetical protein COD17_09845 [Bacillus thuringiensis]
MNPLIKKYMEEIPFEEVESTEITVEKLQGLQVKEGIVCPTRTVNLFVSRELSVMDVLGIATVMESVTQYTITDPFGCQIWTGDATDTLEYIKGFIS